MTRNDEGRDDNVVRDVVRDVVMLVTRRCDRDLTHLRDVTTGVKGSRQQRVSQASPAKGICQSCVVDASGGHNRTACA